MTAQLDQGVAARSPDTDGLVAWAERTGRRPAAAPGRGRLRFAFYGRVSTEDYQDPVTSRARQCGQAGALVAGYGQIVAEFFDIGQSRTLAWARRPQAAALVAGLADPDRGWDAVAIGEYKRGAAPGIVLVQRQARLPVPARPHHRHPPRPRPAAERLHPRGPYPAPAPGPGHPPRRPWPQPPQAGHSALPGPGRGGSDDQLPEGPAHHTHLRPGRAYPPRRHPRRCIRHHRPQNADRKRIKQAELAGRAPAPAGGQAWVTLQHARIQPLMGKLRVRLEHANTGNLPGPGKSWN